LYTETLKKTQIVCF